MKVFPKEPVPPVIKNDLFDLPNTSMVFGDAKKVLTEMIGELKDLGVGEK